MSRYWAVRPLQHHGGPGVKGYAIGQFAHALGRHHAQITVAASGLTGVGSAVSRLEVGNAGANGFHHARRLHAQLQRHGHGVETAALIDIDVVQPHRLVADADFARAGLAHVDLNELELFGATMLGDLNSAGVAKGHVLAFERVKKGVEKGVERALMVP